MLGHSRVLLRAAPSLQDRGGGGACAVRALWCARVTGVGALGAGPRATGNGQRQVGRCRVGGPPWPKWSRRCCESATRTVASICRTTTPSGAPVLSIARLLSSVMPIEHVPHDAAAASGSPPVRRRASARRSRAVTRRAPSSPSSATGRSSLNRPIMPNFCPLYRMGAHSSRAPSWRSFWQGVKRVLKQHRQVTHNSILSFSTIGWILPARRAVCAPCASLARAAAADVARPRVPAPAQMTSIFASGRCVMPGWTRSFCSFAAIWRPFVGLPPGAAPPA